MIPTQFRIFRKGWNDSTKGKVLFDEAAAKAVMDQYSKHGADMMLDLEHLSLNKEIPAYDPNARGWFKLALMYGELWAVDFRPAGDGAQRLEQRTQRYISPAFAVDPKTRRVQLIINAALTALPATDQPMALVAASATIAPGLIIALSQIEGYTMDLTPLLQLLGLPAGATLDDIVKAVQALQAGSTQTSSEPGAGGATAPMVTETADPATAPVPGAARPAMAPPAPAGGPKKTTVSIQHAQTPADTGAAAILELSQTVKSLQDERENEKRLALIKANAKKLTPTLEKWALTQSVDSLTQFFGSQPDLNKVEVEQTHGNTGGVGSEVIQLTQAEKDLCADTGVDPAAVLKHKQTLAAAKGNK